MVESLSSSKWTVRTCEWLSSPGPGNNPSMSWQVHQKYVSNKEDLTKTGLLCYRKSLNSRQTTNCMLLTFKCLYGLAPQYLADLIAVAPQSRYNLRSRNATLLVSAKARCLPTLGDRAFQSAAPKLWNSLPVEIRNIQTLTSFKRALKTYFFKRAF